MRIANHRTWTKLSRDTTTISPTRQVRVVDLASNPQHSGHVPPWNSPPGPQRRSFALGAFDSTKLQAQIADEQQQRNAELPPLGAPVVNVDVGDREVEADGSCALRNLPVTTTPSSKVHEEYLREHGTWIDVHVKSRAKVSL